MNPYSKPTSPISSARDNTSRFANSQTKNPLSDSGFYRSTSQEPQLRDSNYRFNTEKFYSSQRGLAPWKVNLNSTARSAGTTPLYSRTAGNEFTFPISNVQQETQTMSQSQGYFPTQTITSYQVFPSKNESHTHDYGSHQTNTSNINKTLNEGNYSKPFSYSVPPRKYDEEKLQKIIEGARQRQLASLGYDRGRKSSADFKTEDRPLQMRSYNHSQPTTEREEIVKSSSILNYMSNPISGTRAEISNIPQNNYGVSHASRNSGGDVVSPGTTAFVSEPVRNISLNLEGVGAAGKVGANQNSGYSDSKQYDSLNKYQIKLPHSPGDEEKGFSFRDNKDILRNSSIEQNSYATKSLPFQSVENYQSHDQIIKSILDEAKNGNLRSSLVGSDIKARSYQPKESENYYSGSGEKSGDTQLKYESLLNDKSQNYKQEVPVSAGFPTYEKRNREDVYNSPLPSGMRDSSISKKTFYTIENTNAPAMKAFSDTISTLAHSETPEKLKHNVPEIQSPFQELQSALVRQNVHINRVIIETVENYPETGSIGMYRKPEESIRPDSLPVPSKAIFEPPVIQNKPVNQEIHHVSEIQPKAEIQEEIVKRLEYPPQLKNQTESQVSQHKKSFGGGTSRGDLTERDHQEQISSFQEILPQEKSLKELSHQELSLLEKLQGEEKAKEQEEKRTENEVSVQQEKEEPKDLASKSNMEESEIKAEKSSEINKSRKSSSSSSPSKKSSSEKKLSFKEEEQQDALKSEKDGENELSLEKKDSNKSRKSEEINQVVEQEEKQLSKENSQEIPKKDSFEEEEKKEFVNENYDSGYVREPEHNFVNQRFVEQQEPELEKRSQYQNIETKKSEKVKPKSSNLAVKAVVVLLVLLLLGILGMELELFGKLE